MPSHSKSQVVWSWIPVLAMALVWTLGCDAKKLDKNNLDTPTSPKRLDKDKEEALAEHRSSMRFSGVAADSGISFEYQNGQQLWLVAMIESNGGGLGWIDYDRDGNWDLFLPGGGLLNSDRQPIMVPNGLYRQIASQADSAHLFSPVAERAYVQDGVCYSFGVAVGDYNADGFSDMFITGWGGQQLLCNLGDGTFQDVTDLAGFSHRGWSSSAAWLDADNDGDLDLYIAHYGVWTPETDKRCTNSTGQLDRCAPADYVGEPDELWINQGDGSFLDRSREFKEFEYRGIGVLAADFDHDGDTDIYVSNDEDPNMLFDNRGESQFQQIAAQSGTALGSRSIVDGSMGLALGDFDGNLKPDMLVTNYQNEYCELYLNQGNQYFTLGTRSSGLMALGQAVVGWGTAFADLDLDGDEDLLVIAGHTSRNPIKSSNLQKPYLLENKDSKRLVSVGESSGDFFGQVHAGRGMALADYDNDGDLDFAVSMIEQPTELLRNDSPKGNYLLVDLIGRQVNRDAIGAWLELELTGGKRPGAKQIRHRFGGGSYASTHASTLHIGLGDATGVSKLTVHWPGGKTDSLTDLLPNQRLCVIESVD